MITSNPTKRPALAGGDARMEASYVAHRDAVWRFFVRRVGDGDLAEDLTSEVFVVAWRRRGDAPADALPWLYGTARRVLAEDRRAARRRTALDARLAGEAAVGGGAAGADAPGEGLGGSAVMAALARLAEPDRELLLLAAWEDLDPAEIAVVLRIRPSTARVRLHRARRRLAYHLDHDGATR
ncbi:RNA polymerase sigma factor [Baekduia sp. Peel2402]|uniref:RNA polymerase sigma factor n=1 Tax=Baekduia sp. Peel2402 TaxID=3458296 RepID=UPI00403E5D0F